MNGAAAAFFGIGARTASGKFLGAIASLLVGYLVDEAAGPRLREVWSATQERGIASMQPAEIEFIRETFNLSQRDLAKALNVAPYTIARWETGANEPVKRDNGLVLPSVVAGHLKDLRGLLDRDTERARALLAKLLGPITLRRDGDRLVAELRGNLQALLGIDEGLDNPGAGRGI